LPGLYKMASSLGFIQENEEDLAIADQSFKE
jgi:hypothetical protein